jgi:hypothetical protein
MGLIATDLTPVEGKPSTWIDEDGHTYIGSDGMTLDEFVAAANAAPTLSPRESDYGRAVQAMLDAKAQERNYDSIATAVSYRDDPNATYAAEGSALFDWRSAVWTYGYTQLAAVKAGTRTPPSVVDFITEVEQNCPFEWPAGT